MSKTRGVRGAAGWCAIAAILYLLARSLLYAGISALVGVVHPCASLAKPIGVSEVGLGLLQIVIAVGAALVPLLWMLRGTRLQTDDLRITVPAPWSPAFCLPVFLGVASTANLCGGLLVRLAGAEDAATLLPSGGAELFVQFLALCAVPAVVEELLFRGALQGLMRPSGSAAAIFGPALLFGLLHLDLAQGLTAFACGVFQGWLAERSGSILPGMLLHFCNNTLAFLNLYLRFYAPQPVSFGVELFILFFFPVFGVWLIWQKKHKRFCKISVRCCEKRGRQNDAKRVFDRRQPGHWCGYCAGAGPRGLQRGLYLPRPPRSRRGCSRPGPRPFPCRDVSAHLR